MVFTDQFEKLQVSLVSRLLFKVFIDSKIEA